MKCIVALFNNLFSASKISVWKYATVLFMKLEVCAFFDYQKYENKLVILENNIRLYRKDIGDKMYNTWWAYVTKIGVCGCIWVYVCVCVGRVYVCVGVYGGVGVEVWMCV